MVPDNHELVLIRTPALIKFLESPEFAHEIVPKLKAQHEVELSVHQTAEEVAEDGSPTVTLLWTFTRNPAGGLRDAIEFLNALFASVFVVVLVVLGSFF